MSALTATDAVRYRDLAHRFNLLLTDEMSQRKDRQGTVTLTNGCSELEWVWEERAAMWRAVEQERRLLGRPPLTISDVEYVENQAAGHSDYAKKFASHCACLALDIDPRPW